MRPLFVSNDTVRTYCRPALEGQKHPPTDLQVIDADIGESEVRTAAVVPDLESIHSIAADPAHGRVLIWGMPVGEVRSVVRVCTWSSHEPLYDIPQPGGPFGVRSLADGRIATVRTVDGRLELVLRDELGGAAGAIDLGRGAAAWLGHQTSPGRLAVAVFRDARGFDRRFDTIEVDLTSGDIRPIGRQLLPAVSNLGDVHDTLEPGSIPTRCFRGVNGQLLIMDPATGELDQVTPGTAEPDPRHEYWNFW